MELSHDLQATLERMRAGRSEKPQIGVFKHRILEERTLEDEKQNRWAVALVDSLFFHLLHAEAGTGPAVAGMCELRWAGHAC